ncbi:hypothetical protein [Natronosalvus vescus]|uniref:hypothetical protein n=1 Tax=Natronosalvus vescus TaxID=2953881 RepID=UPI002090DFB4|nr:hypothetical protein [Natronosalvus vescus]
MTVPETDSAEDGRSGRSRWTNVRVVGTALSLVGVPSYAIYTFGASVLVTNGAAVVILLGLAELVHELLNR